MILKNIYIQVKLLSLKKYKNIIHLKLKIMKKLLLMVGLFVFMCNFSFATTKETKVRNFVKQTQVENQKKLEFSMGKLIESKGEFSRMTCTVYYTDSDGTVYSATASSGWLLSNDANSLAKACEKATALLYQMLAPHA